MRTRNIHTIRTDVMLSETGYYRPTATEAAKGFKAFVPRSGLDRRGERMLVA